MSEKIDLEKLVKSEYDKIYSNKKEEQVISTLTPVEYKKFEHDKRPTSNSEETKGSSSTGINNLVVISLPILFSLILLLIYYLSTLDYSNLQTNEVTQNIDTVAQPVVDSTKKDTTKVSVPDISLNDSTSSHNINNTSNDFNDKTTYKTITSIENGYSFEIPTFFQSEPHEGKRLEFYYVMSNTFFVHSWVKDDYSFSEQLLKELDSETLYQLKSGMEKNGDLDVELYTAKIIYINNRQSFLRTYSHELNGDKIYSEEIIQVRGTKLIVINQSCKYELRDAFVPYFYHIRNSLD